MRFLRFFLKKRDKEQVYRITCFSKRTNTTHILTLKAKSREEAIKIIKEGLIINESRSNWEILE